MADEWYFGWGAHRFGPFSESQLIELAQNGRVHRSDTVWKIGIAKGILAEKVGNLFPPVPLETPSSEMQELATSTRIAAPMNTVAMPAALPTTASSFNKWLALTGEEKIAAGEHQVPDDLTLKAIPGLDDSPTPISPATSRSEDGHAAESKSTSRPGAATDRSNGEPKPPKQKRAVALKGAVIANQDGDNVQYRKKCLRCGFENPSRTSRPIRTGIHRERFFCPKCRKTGEVEIQGIC